MITCEKAKELLSRRRKDVSHFTEDFFNTFVLDRHMAVLNLGRGGFDSVKKTDFYTLNGGAYCEFLEVINSTLPKFRFRVCENGVWHDGSVGAFDDEFEARAVAMQMKDIFNYDDVGVEKC